MRRTLTRLAVAATMLSAAACTTSMNNTTNPTPGTADPTERPTPSITTAEPDTTPADPDDINTILDTPSLAALTAEQHDCVRQQLTANPTLVDNHLTNPDHTTSNDLADLAARCITATDHATAFAASLQEATNNQLNDEQLDCATTAYANLDPTDIDAILAIGINPNDDHTQAQQLLDNLLDTCNIEL